MPVRKGIGPTTGVIVGADGYIISSAFNFANKPSAILVAVPGHKERYVGKRDRHRPDAHADAAQDRSPSDLPVPDAAPKKDIQIGQTAIAVGRTLAAERRAACRRSASASSAPWTASGARRSRPTPRCRRPTTAGR